MRTFEEWFATQKTPQMTEAQRLIVSIGLKIAFDAGRNISFMFMSVPDAIFEGECKLSCKNPDYDNDPFQNFIYDLNNLEEDTKYRVEFYEIREIK